MTDIEQGQVPYEAPRTWHFEDYDDTSHDEYDPGGDDE